MKPAGSGPLRVRCALTVPRPTAVGFAVAKPLGAQPMLDRDILKALHDHEEDRPLLDLRTVFGIPNAMLATNRTVSCWHARKRNRSGWTRKDWSKPILSTPCRPVSGTTPDQ